MLLYSSAMIRARGREAVGRTSSVSRKWSPSSCGSGTKGGRTSFSLPSSVAGSGNATRTTEIPAKDRRFSTVSAAAMRLPPVLYTAVSMISHLPNRSRSASLRPHSHFRHLATACRLDSKRSSVGLRDRIMRRSGNERDSILISWLTSHRRYSCRGRGEQGSDD